MRAPPPRQGELPKRPLSCLYYKGLTSDEYAQRLVQELYPNSSATTGHGGTQGTWDIEDLVAVAEPKSGCPYYTSRAAAFRANIVFCPYNYILDPEIASTMGISLAGAIIVVIPSTTIFSAYACRRHLLTVPHPPLSSFSAGRGS